MWSVNGEWRCVWSVNRCVWIENGSVGEEVNGNEGCSKKCIMSIVTAVHTYIIMSCAGQV